MSFLFEMNSFLNSILIFFFENFISRKIFVWNISLTFDAFLKRHNSVCVFLNETPIWTSWLIFEKAFPNRSPTRNCFFNESKTETFVIFVTFFNTIFNGIIKWLFIISLLMEINVVISIIINISLKIILDILITEFSFHIDNQWYSGILTYGLPTYESFYWKLRTLNLWVICVLTF